jgi:hypothetical protein
VLGKNFSEMLDGSSTHQKSKREILATYFMNNVAKRRLGPYVSIDNVAITLYPKVDTDMDYIKEEEYFVMVDQTKSTCETTSCIMYGITNTSTGIRPNGMYLSNAASTSVSKWVKKVLKRSLNRHCEKCRFIMKVEYDIVSLPHVLTLHLPQFELNFDIENEIVLNNEKYELCSVIYVGHGHFVTRSMVNGVAKEYDGMKSQGKFRILNEASPFKPKIIDLCMVSRKAETILYRKISSSGTVIPESQAKQKKTKPSKGIKTPK